MNGDEEVLAVQHLELSRLEAWNAYHLSQRDLDAERNLRRQSQLDHEALEDQLRARAMRAEMWCAWLCLLLLILIAVVYVFAQKAGLA